MVFSFDCASNEGYLVESDESKCEHKNNGKFLFKFLCVKIYILFDDFIAVIIKPYCKFK